MSDIVKKSQPVDFGMIVSAAVEKGLDAAALKDLLAVYERVRAGNAKQEFDRAYAAFKATCPPVQRKSINAQFKTVDRNGQQVWRKYASLEDIEATIREPLGANGLSFRWTSAVVDGGKLTLTCVVSHEGGHSESSVVTIPIDSKAGCSEQQKMGAALTYAQRYSLVQALGITTADEDEDGNDPPSETINEHQAANLDAMIQEICPLQRSAFCKWLGVDRIEDCPASKFKEAVAKLESKRGAK